MRSLKRVRRPRLHSVWRYEKETVEGELLLFPRLLRGLVSVRFRSGRVVREEFAKEGSETPAKTLSGLYLQRRSHDALKMANSTLAFFIGH